MAALVVVLVVAAAMMLLACGWWSSGQARGAEHDPLAAGPDWRRGFDIRPFF